MPAGPPSIARGPLRVTEGLGSSSIRQPFFWTFSQFRGVRRENQATNERDRDSAGCTAKEVEARRKSGLTLIFVADSWYALVRCVGEHSGNVAGRLLNALCLSRDRLCHDVRLRRDGIWRRSRDAPLPYCARLEPLDFSG